MKPPRWKPWQPGRAPDYDRGVLLIVDGPRNRPRCVPRPSAAAGRSSIVPAGAAPAGRRRSPRPRRAHCPAVIGPLVAGIHPRSCSGPASSTGTAAVWRPRAPAAAPRAGIPEACSLGDAPSALGGGHIRRWSESGQRRGLAVPVGIGSSGPLRLDLQADGPHFLVAGTTGSGKSEFLRTLAAALAAAHPPDRVNLLFIDFKGGSGLGPLTGLPHCVGLLTDLGDQRGGAHPGLPARRSAPPGGAARRVPGRRSHGLRVPRIPRGPPLPHLVLIIDEFRMLVEEAPEALAELMRIAAIGRSLGIHLIMATQRPQGAVSADIRANVTSCIALRVQSEMESIDIINSRLAAAIPITSPGRAYLVRGNEAPEEFQTATIPPPATRDGPRPDRDAGDGIPEPARRPAVPPDAATAPPRIRPGRLHPADGGSNRGLGGARRQPAAPSRRRCPSPRPLPFPADGSRGRIRLGLLDLPEEQRVTEFGWHPGTPRPPGTGPGHSGGADAALALIVDQLLGCDDERTSTSWMPPVHSAQRSRAPGSEP